MTASDFLKRKRIPFTAKTQILAILTGSDRHMTLQKYNSVAKKTQLPDNFKLPTNVLSLMEKVNRMVKSEDCPNNYRNRFYSNKLHILKFMNRSGRVSEVYDEGHCYSMLVDGKYLFHQLKDCYRPEELNIVGKREYIRETKPIKFNKDLYTRFELAAAYYLGKMRKKRDKNKNEPKKVKPSCI